MTILDEFIQSINKTIQEYERATLPTIPLERAKEIAVVKSEVDKNHTALSLRGALAQKIDTMAGSPLKLPIFLDWNGFRRRLRQLLDSNKYSVMAILIIENGEMQNDRIQLSQTVAKLTYKVERGEGGPNPLINKLEAQIMTLAQRLEEQEVVCHKIQLENDFLMNQLTSVEKERDLLQQKLHEEEKKSEQLYQQLMLKIAELTEVKSKLTVLEEKKTPATNLACGPSPYAKLY